jgi:Mn-containing catalase
MKNRNRAQSLFAKAIEDVRNRQLEGRVALTEDQQTAARNDTTSKKKGFSYLDPSDSQDVVKSGLPKGSIDSGFDPGVLALRRKETKYDGTTGVPTSDANASSAYRQQLALRRNRSTTRLGG